MPNTWLGRDSQGILRDFTSSDVSDTTTPLNIQRLRLLGPFAVTYQTSGISTAAGALITTLDAGVLLLKSMLISTAYFEQAAGANPTLIDFHISTGDGSDAEIITHYDPENQQVSNVGQIEGNLNVGGTTHLNVLASAGFTTQATQLRLRVGGTLVAGAGRVFALIAESV